VVRIIKIRIIKLEVELVKLIYICQSYHKNSRTFCGPQCSVELKLYSP